MGKNKGKNGFYYFFSDFENQQRAKGLHYANKIELTEAAGVIWQKLSKADRAQYDIKAKNKASKLNCLGEDVKEIQRQEEMKKILTVQEDVYIKSLIESKFDNNEFANIYFYVGHIGYYCHYNSVGSVYYPAEVGVVRFNLINGVDLNERFHTIINICQLPMGYKFTAQTHAAETHRLPLPSSEYKNGGIDEKMAFENMLYFIEDFKQCNGTNDELTPIYFTEENIPVAQSVLSKNGFDEKFKVYNLSKLLFVLKNATHSNVSKTPAWPTMTFPNRELMNDIFEYERGISCEYHTENDAFQQCSLSIATRRAYLLCYFCCEDLQIEMIPGRHIPLKQMAANSFKKVTNSKPGSNTDKNGVKKHEVENNDFLRIKYMNTGAIPKNKKS